MPDYLSKSEIAQVLSDQGLGGKRQIMNVLDGLRDLSVDELAAGRDFVVPGIAKIAYSYAPAQKKGERWSAGEEVIGFGGITSVKESASPARKARVKLSAKLMGDVAKLRIRSDEMTTFLKSKAGRTVVARKGK